MKPFRYSTLLGGLGLMLVACGGGGDSTPPPPSPAYTIDLAFDRLAPDTLSSFTVTATLRKDGALLGGVSSDLAVTLGQGSGTAPTELSTGVYRFTVTPTQTGEHPVTVSYLGASVRRTALVLESVDPAWGQPMAVEGLVNTPGYEDGVTVSPDGEYLFVQYGPVYFSGFLLFNTARPTGCGGNRLSPTRCSHAWLDQFIGPYAAPERPGFFDGRINTASNTSRHNAISWGVGDEQSPVFAASTMFYGFRRQADGSFAEPFYLAFADANDGIIGPYGLSFMMHNDGTATALFALDDPADTDQVDLGGGITAASQTDVFTAEITLGQNNILGTYVASGTPGTAPVRGAPFPSQLVDFGKTGSNGIAGTQGNPHLYQSGGAVKSIWTDDERDSDADYGEISAYALTAGALTSGSWTKVVLPGPVNQASPHNEIQPFYTGSGLYFTHSSNVNLPEVFYSAYSGTDSAADYGNASKWGTPAKILGVGTANSVGKVTAIGEPTIATRSDGEYLYFVYGVIRDNSDPSGIADINMQAGYVKKR